MSVSRKLPYWLTPFLLEPLESASRSQAPSMHMSRSTEAYALLAWLFTGSVGFHLVSMVTASLLGAVQPYIVVYIFDHHVFSHPPHHRKEHN